MPRGDKFNHTDKQERKADHIAKGHGKRDVSENEAELRAWATASKESGGASKSGAGRREMETQVSAKSGEIGGKASASRPAAQRSASAKKATATRKHNAEHHAHH
ncbi:plasmid stabilization protein [Devosia sp. D6-9]|nr:plasmid stabilization protein [Devosia sp. D6-9]